MRVLTKSRFKLGLECPNKLFFTRKQEYANSKNEDTFLKSLAQGGFQVEEYARMHYQGGILVEGNDGDYQLLWEETQELLKQENVIIYEAAFLYQNLFIRVDILKKTGDTVELIEVKAKSWNDDNDSFLNTKDVIRPEWHPYLFDVAFQNYVIQKCFPQWNIKSFMTLANKKESATIEGLNQLFRIEKQGNNRTGIKTLVSDFKKTGVSVLIKKDISDIVENTIDGKHKCLDGKTFEEALILLENNYVKDVFPAWNPSYSSCKNCEFKANVEQKRVGLVSGFEKCFSEILGWRSQDFETPNTFNIWDFRDGSKLFDGGIYFKKQLTESLVKVKQEPDKISRTQRQWIQIEKEINLDNSIYLLKNELKKELDGFIFPLHFIDFETATVALPFNTGRKPYEQIAFQFSHHTYSDQGFITHQTEFINTEKGKFPNFDFVRNLKVALSNDNGTILRYSNHENTVLNAIRSQLFNSTEPDKNELIDFIELITHSTGSGIGWKGNRDMVDLWEIVKKYYYNPRTFGSNSIKDVLPAALQSSKYLQKKYSKPITEIELTSRNFSSDHVWLKIENNEVQNPYKQLPPVFNDWSEEELESALTEIGDINEGGAALIAYSRLQYTDMSVKESESIQGSLLKYCELDTLAMIMIYEHLKEITE